MSREAQVRFCESRAVRSRPATHLVVVVHGTRADTEALREDVTRVLAPMGLALSPAKTQVVHMSDGFDFLGFHIQWKRKRGSNKWYVYTFIADRPIRSVKAKIRALTHKKSQQDLRSVLIRLNQIMRGWANYFKHAVAKHIFNSLTNFAWTRVVTMTRYRHRWKWKDVRGWLTDHTGRWHQPAADGTELFNMAKVPVTRYRYRGSSIPNPWPLPDHA
jgi:RNA-directed DNA polymerase